jgi:hypothetical protein
MAMKKDASRSLARSGAWCGRARLVPARPEATVSENGGAGYGRKSCGGAGQGRVRFLRRQSELSAQLSNQHILDVGQPRRTAQV